MKKQEAIDAALKFVSLLFSDFPSSTIMMSDDFVWENFLPSHVPFGRRYEGASGMQIYIGELAANWGLGELVCNDYVYDPDTRTLVVTGVERQGKALPTGRTCDMPFAWEFRFTEDNKISYGREYNDTYAIAGTFDKASGS